MPERLRETLAPSVAPDAALAMAHPPEEEFVDPTDWETEFFSELEPVRSFHHLGHSSPFAAKRDKNTILHPYERPNFTYHDREEGCTQRPFLFLSRLILPNNNMRGRTAVVSKVPQNIGPFKKRNVQVTVEHA